MMLYECILSIFPSCITWLEFALFSYCCSILYTNIVVINECRHSHTVTLHSNFTCVTSLLCCGYAGNSLEVKIETDSNDAMEIKTEADSNDITKFQHDGRPSIGMFGLFKC